MLALAISDLLLAVQVLVSYCQTVSSLWKPETFPDPWTNPKKCGLPFQSWICDPDGLIKANEYGRLQDALVELYNSEHVVNCSNSTKVGIRLAVLAVDKVNVDHVCQETSGPEWRMRCLEKYV